MERYQGIDDIQRNKINEKYKIILEDESIYLEKTKNWKFLLYITGRVLLISILSMLICIGLDIEEPYFSISPLIMFSTMFIALYLITKISGMDDKFGLRNQDLVFLETYRTIENFDKLISNPSRNQCKLDAISNMQKAIEHINDWDYGNLDIVKDFIGKEFDLFKENMKNKTSGNINEKGVGAHILMHTLLEFLIYLINPTKDQLDKVNEMFSTLEPVEYIILSKQEIIFARLSNYLYERPNIIRISFGLILAIAVYIFGNIKLKYEIIDTLAPILAAFFGGFTISNQIFSIKERERARKL